MNKKFAANEKKNKKYLAIFEQYLEENYPDYNAEVHYESVAWYLNGYLCIGLIREMQDGCSNEVLGFIENWINERTLPSDVHNIDTHLYSIKLFYKCMCENGYVSKEQYDDLLEFIEYTKDEMIENFYYKNPVDIYLDEVIDALIMAHGYGDCYMNIKTSDYEIVPFDHRLYDGDIDQLIDKVEGMCWSQLPNFDDREIMKKFAHGFMDKEKANKLLEAANGKMALSKFRDVVEELDIERDYFEYRYDYISALAKHWMDENGLEYFDDEEFDDELDGIVDIDKLKN